MAVNGSTILMKIGANVIGSQKGVSINSNAEMLDVSTKDDSDGVFIAGKRTDELTLSSFYIVGDSNGYGALRSAYEAGTAVDIYWAEGGTDYKRCQNALVSSISLDAPADGPSECEVSLQISGGWGAP